MSLLNPFVILPVAVMVLVLLTAGFYKNVQYPSPLMWGKMFKKIGPMRAHQVIDFNEKIEKEEPAGWWARRKERRRYFKVNWGYLCVQTQNTTAFLQALRFEELKIRASKPVLRYERLEMAIVALIEEATELRWEQVRWQLVLQLVAGLGVRVDKEIFHQLLADYKFLEEHMLALARKEGGWLHQMLMERLGLTEWRVIEGGQTGPG
jgi:hypothetical protein